MSYRPLTHDQRITVRNLAITHQRTCIVAWNEEEQRWRIHWHQADLVLPPGEAWVATIGPMPQSSAHLIERRRP